MVKFVTKEVILTAQEYIKLLNEHIELGKAKLELQSVKDRVYYLEDCIMESFMQTDKLESSDTLEECLELGSKHFPFNTESFKALLEKGITYDRLKDYILVQWYKLQNGEATWNK